MRNEHLFPTLDEARTRILSSIDVLGTQEAGGWCCAGRVLRQQIRSVIDCPQVDISLRDGYCLKAGLASAASTTNPVTLPVKGKSTPGREPSLVQTGTCAVITTGAPLPDGADAVVKYEDVEEREDSITITHAVRPGDYVRKRGEVARKGDIILEPGRLIDSTVEGVVVSLGPEVFEVSLQPRAGVIATGDELVPACAEVPPYSVRNSNTPVLFDLLADNGCELGFEGWSDDKEDSIVHELEWCLDDDPCDLVIISGGISGGRYDFVPAALERIGARILLRGIRMRPGKPLLFAKKGSTVFFAVPGNPVSVVVTFHMVIKPTVYAMQGREDCEPVALKAKCGEAFERKSAYTTFAPGVLDSDLEVRPARFLGSGDIGSLVEANCLVCVPEDVPAIDAGEIADVYPIGHIRTAGRKARRGS